MRDTPPHRSWSISRKPTQPLACIGQRCERAWAVERRRRRLTAPAGDVLLTRVNTRRIPITLLLASLFAAGGACSQQQKPEPEIASSAGEFGYAARFPAALSAERARLDAYENRAKRFIPKFANYPGELNEPDWAHVLGVVERADQAGRSGSFVARVREVDSVEGFFDDEKEVIGRKVGGAADYAASQKGCKKSGAYGAATNALDKSVKKQLEERLRAHNEAHLYLEENSEALGKANIEKLETQADEISYASYVTHIAVVEVKVRLREMIAQADDIKSTLDRKIKEADAVLADTNRSDVDKKSAQEGKDSAQKALGDLDSEVKQAQFTLEGIEERIKTLQEQYQQSFDGLTQAIEQKMK